MVYLFYLCFQSTFFFYEHERRNNTYSVTTYKKLSQVHLTILQNYNKYSLITFIKLSQVHLYVTQSYIKSNFDSYYLYLRIQKNWIITFESLAEIDKILILSYSKRKILPQHFLDFILFHEIQAT